MNFNDMPCDIMKKIMNINKNEEMNEAFKNSHQTYFNNVKIELLKKNKQNEIIVRQLKLRNILKSIQGQDELYNEILELQGCETPEDIKEYEWMLALNLQSPFNYIDTTALYPII